MNAIRLCPTGKWGYADERGARKALRVWGSTPDHLQRKGYAPCRAYRCPRCGLWHLTGSRSGRHPKPTSTPMGRQPRARKDS
jgi:hypothetical protein